MKKLFNLVYELLMFLADLTGFSYKEVNIIIWYIIIPLSWAVLLDKIVKKQYFKLSLLLVIITTFIIIDSFSEFSEMLFNTSADFLRSFNALGSNYTNSSVIICILIPIIIYYFLIKKAYFVK
jgi:hypothetical protein